MIRNGSDPRPSQVAIDNILGYPFDAVVEAPPDTVAHGCGASGTALYQVGAIWIDAPRPDCDLDQLRAA